MNDPDMNDASLHGAITDAASVTNFSILTINLLKGVIYRDGYIYVPDVNSGLWIVKVDAKNALTP